jgi:hypothetical protein
LATIKPQKTASNIYRFQEKDFRANPKQTAITLERNQGKD